MQNAMSIADPITMLPDFAPFRYVYWGPTFLSVSAYLNFAGSVSLLLSFFFIAPQVLKVETLNSMMRIPSEMMAHRLTRFYSGVLVFEVVETNWGYFPKPMIEGKSWEPKRIFTKRFFTGSLLLLIPGRLSGLFLGFLLSATGLIALLFLALFLRWASWESELRGWAIVIGVLSFIFGATTQIVIAAGKL